jgi:hypothetical protein
LATSAAEHLQIIFIDLFQVSKSSNPTIFLNGPKVKAHLQLFFIKMSGMSTCGSVSGSNLPDGVNVTKAKSESDSKAYL